MKYLNRIALVLGVLCAAVSCGQHGPAHVLIVAGQSNTDGRAPLADLPGYIAQYASDSSNIAGAYPLCKLSRNRLDGQFEPFWPIKRGWAYDAVVCNALEQFWGEEFYVVKWAEGGTCITHNKASLKGGCWSPDAEWLAGEKPTGEGGRSLLLSLLAQIDACIDSTLSRLPEGYRFDAFLWHQGESDLHFGSEYYDNLKGVLGTVRRHLSERTGVDYSGLPFIFGTVSRHNRDFDPEVEAAMHRLADEDANVYLIDMSDAGLQGDRLHFTKTSTEYFGREMTEIIKGLDR